MANKHTVILDRTKETKGAFQFTEVDKHGGNVLGTENGQVIGTVYVRKSALGEGVKPDFVTVEITAHSDAKPGAKKREDEAKPKADEKAAAAG